MKNRTQGFTLIELLIVVAIIGILAAVLIPNLLGARTKANDAAANSIGRQVLTAMAATEAGNTTGTLPTCLWAAPGITTITAGTESARVNSPAPATNVQCRNINDAGAVQTTAATATRYEVTVTYAGGGTASKVYTADR